MNKEVIQKLASEILLEAGMKVVVPTRTQSREILKALRSHFGIEAVSRPLWRQYVTFMSDRSNKFHYFIVFQDGDRFTAANAYGRIGYRPKVVELFDGESKAEALSVAKKKLKAKTQKGYKVTQL